MREPVSPEVRRECRALTRWLVGRAPTDYVIERYARGLGSTAFRADVRSGTADPVLHAVGRTGQLGLSLAQTYARIAAPAGSFRRRAVLLGAILESAPDTFAAFEPPAAGRLRAWSVLIGSGMLFAARVLAALILIGPLHLAARLVGRRAARARAE
jgi:hypothetical protein